MNTDELIQGLRQILDDRQNVKEFEPYCGECGAKLSAGLESEWISRYAEQLGCDARPSAVAVAIDGLLEDVARVRSSIKRHRANAFELGKQSMQECQNLD